MNKETVKLTLIIGTQGHTCQGCYFNSPSSCRKSKDKIFKNISCVGRDENGKEQMGYFRAERRQ